MAQLTFVKVRFGGERQWCRVMKTIGVDKFLVCVDNHPVIDGAALWSEHIIKRSEVLDFMTGKPPLEVIDGGRDGTT